MLSPSSKAAAPSVASIAAPGWEHFEHGADAGIRGRGRSVEECFAQAGLALTALAVAPAEVRSERPVQVTCHAPDRELLLFDWLNAIILQMATRGMVFGRFEVKMLGNRLTGTLWGEPLDRSRHHVRVEPKGATLTGLKVAVEAPGVWVAQCVVDV